MSASKQTYKVCFCFRRRFKLIEAVAPEEVKTLFELYSENGVMTVDHLHRFLVEFQGEDKATKEDAQAIIDASKHLLLQRRGFYFDSFFRYLFGDTNPPLSPTLGVHHDMTAPLSHYFIYTGHNSYLTGNQYSSDCSDAPIIMALKRGVRVIKLDMWPNSANNNIDILHGRTLTTPVSLLKCLSSIKEHAFSASPFPLVITLEDHLTPDLQAKVAVMVTETFGDMLFTSGKECVKELPSPDSLKNRVLISTKPPKEYLESKSVKEKRTASQKDNDSAKEEVWAKEVPDLKSKLEADNKNNPDGEDSPDDDDYDDDDLDDGDHKLPQTRDSDLDDGNHEMPQTTDSDLDDGDHNLPQTTDSAYKRLIAIHAGKLKGGLDQALKNDPNKVRHLSLSESALEKAAMTRGTSIVRFTQRNMLRIYPKGTRINSSNYNPLIAWMHGAQMVAFNMQGYGRYLWLMHGMFRANGECGYLKKPDFLLNVGLHNEVFDPKAPLPVKQILKVMVFTGEGWYNDFHHTNFYNIYSPPDFYTKIGIAGVPADSRMLRTKIIEDNWTPVWNEEFEFPLTVPELALLRIECHEYDMSGKVFPFGNEQVQPSTNVVGSSWKAVVKTEEDTVQYNSHPSLHYIDRQSQYSGSFSGSYRRDKQFPFLPDNNPVICHQSVAEASVCQPLLNTIASSQSGITNRKTFSDGLNRVLDSDCALSLLSSPPTQSSGINMSHLVQPDSIPIAQPLVSGMQFNGLGGYHSEGMEGQQMIPVLVSDANDSEINCNGIYTVGSSQNEVHQRLPFTWE